MSDVNKITLGSGTLYLNNVDVGYLKGDVELTYKSEKREIKPNGYMNPISLIPFSEEVHLKAPIAELKLSMVKYAIGTTTTVDSSSSIPAYDPSSFSGTSGSSYDTLTFGGNNIMDTTSLRFEHTRPLTNGKKTVVILYKVANIGDLLLSFKEEEETIFDLDFRGLAVEGRSRGDRVGVLLDEVDQSS